MKKIKRILLLSLSTLVVFMCFILLVSEEKSLTLDRNFSNFIALNDDSDNQTAVQEDGGTTPNPNGTTTSPTTGAETATGSKNLILKKLEITSHEIQFDPYKYEYSLDVDLDVKSLNIVVEPEDETVTALVSSNAYSLKDGENLITITLTDTLGNTNTYQIKVNRVEPKSNNNYLASISVTGYQLNFNPSITSYNLETGKVSSLDIQVVTESELASYEILGNSGLSDGSVITIRVTAEDGSTRNYIINISRVFNIMDYWIYILVALLVFLLLVILLIIKKNKNKKKMGPATIEGSKNTAGVIQEIAPQNMTQTVPVNQDTNNATIDLGTPTEKATLKIIEPTNIEIPADVQPQNTNMTIDEDDNPTEVFKL